MHRSVLTGPQAVSVGSEMVSGRSPGDLAFFGILVGIVLQALPLSAQVSAALVGGSAGMLIVVEKPRLVLRSNDGMALYLFGAAFLAASFVSILGSASLSRSLDVSVSLLPQILVFHAIASRFGHERAERLVWALVGMGAAISCVFLFTALGNPAQSPTQWMKIAGLPYLSVPNDLLILALVAPFSAIWLLRHTVWPIKAAAGMTLLMALATLTIYESRSGVALFVISCVLVVAMRAGASWRKTVSVLGISVCLLLLVDASSGFRLAEKFAHVQTLSLRVPLWAAAWKMFLGAPSLGHGPGMFSPLYEGYLAGIRFPDWVLMSPAIHSPWAHSLYLELLAERGLAGFVSFMGFLIIAGRLLRSFYLQSRGDLLWIALTAAFTLILLGGLSEFSLLRYWFVQFLLVSVAMVFALNNVGEAQDEEAT